MRELILLDRIMSDGPAAGASGSAAVKLQADSAVTLRFRFAAADGPAIEAIRHARRAMLREEWTRGRDRDEPSLENADFSADGVVWVVLSGQQEWCLKKMSELVARANRTLETLEAGQH